MNRRTLGLIGLGLLLAVSLTRPATAADAPDLTGKWKLVLLSFNEFPYGIVSVSGSPEELTGEVTSVQPQFGQPKVTELKLDGDKVRLELQTGVRKDTFTGAAPKEADKPIFGVLRLQGQLHPARLERTTQDAIERPAGENLARSAMLLGANKEMPAAEKVAKLKELISQNASVPAAAHAYDALIRNAEKADLSADEIQGVIVAWMANAAPYGPDWSTATRDKIIAAIGAQGKYAKAKLALAQEAQKELASDAPLDRQAEIARLVADSAKAAGNDELAKTADVAAARLEKEAASARLAKAEADLKALPETATTEQRSMLTKLVADNAKAAGATEIAKNATEAWHKLEAQLDDEYHQNVPPFKPEPFGGRKDPQDNRVVLLELFTGAQCPPCVAADVAFDALVGSYKPSELIGLQYHLHIPGPDPLTNSDTEARAKYYGVRGTPSTYFNGESLSGGGGPMQNSKKKYDDYLKIIGADLAGLQPAKIDLKLSRSGDSINVTVSAQATDENVTAARAAAAKLAAERADDGAKDGDEEKKEPAAGGPQLRLRLVLLQEEVHYVGGNRLRFHHHVVRGMPGGVEGKEFVGGQAENSVTINLADVRAGLEKYLADFQKAGRAFPVALPELDMTKLSVVALVQDDADKAVLGAVQVAVPEAK